MNQNLIKFDNNMFNKLIAYTAIINSLNYKWYKSSKRRPLLPNFYFTRSFYNFYRLFFLKNILFRLIQKWHFSVQLRNLRMLTFINMPIPINNVITDDPP